MIKRRLKNGRKALLGLLLLTVVGTTLVPPTGARAELQPPDPAVFVEPAPVTPDAAYAVGTGRIEVYTSVGDNDGGLDWRPLTQFGYLLSTVPKGAYSRIAVYNTYQDHYSATLNSTTNKWEVRNTSGNVTDGMFVVTKAVRDQLNYYATPQERRAHFMAIGNKPSLEISKTNGSSLADLLIDSGVTKLCSKPKGACLGTVTGSDMHAKFALLSQAKDSTGKMWSNVTMLTTANLNGTSGGRAANTNVVIYGDKNLYDSMVADVWTPMVNERPTAGYWDAATKGIAGSLPGVVYYASPRGKDSSGKYVDVEYNYLRDRLRVNGGPAKTGCKVRVMHSMFSTGRQGIGNSLRDLKKEGCRITIVLDEDFALQVATNYFAMSKWLGDVIGDIRYQNVHDKTMTMQYTTSSGSSNAAFTGSANFNSPGLTADESVIRITQKTGVDAISAHIDKHYSLAKYPTPIPVVSVGVAPTTATIMVGETTKLTASVSPSNATDKTVRWETSNPSVAMVTSDGTVTAVGEGTATIRARSLQGGKEASATITVLPSNLVPSPKVISAPTSVQSGSTATLSVGWPTSTTYTGTVTMQYLDPSTEKWIDGDTVDIVNGKGTYTYTATTNRIWRVKTTTITTPSDAVVTEATRYSASASVLVRPAATTKPTLSGPAKFPAGSTVTFSATWASPYAPAKPAALSLQYQSGTSWVTKKTVTIPSGQTYVDFSLSITGSHTWRVIPASTSVPSGVTRTPSDPIQVLTLGTKAVPTPTLTGPAKFPTGTVVTFKTSWASPFTPTYPARLDLQYKDGTSWKTKTSVTIPNGSTSASFSLKLIGTHDWRVQVASAAVPAGSPRPASTSIRVTAY